jgi:hypothetical protein
MEIDLIDKSKSKSKRAPAKSTAALPFFEFNDGLPSSLAFHPCSCSFPHTDGA